MAIPPCYYPLLFFTGTNDKFPVTFHLYLLNGKFSGSYYYNSTGETIDISGEMSKDHFLKLTHFDLEDPQKEDEPFD